MVNKKKDNMYKKERRTTEIKASITAFLKDCVIVDYKGFITKKEFYKVYVWYCVTHETCPVSISMIGRVLPTIINVREERMTLPEGGRKTAWKGIKLVRNG